MRPTYIYILLGLLSFMLPSCLKDNKEIFDKPAAARIDALIAEEKALLEAAPKGWRMEYYAGRDFSGPGFTLLMKFENGHVTMAGDNVDPELRATSEYSIVRDQGPVLTFPTYNEVIHSLASASLGYPEGIQGDYEFAILSASADTVRLLGKKWGNEMRLVRIPDDSSIEEQILGILNVREGMTASTFDFSLGSKELAQGEIRRDARRLSVKIGERSFDTPFNFTATGITLQSPIVVESKSYSTFSDTTPYVAGVSLPPSPSQLVSEPIPSQLSSPSTESATRWSSPTMLPRVRSASRDRLCTTRRIDMLVVSSSYLHHWLMDASSSPLSSIASPSLGMKISSKPSLRVPSSPMVRSTPSMASPTVKTSILRSSIVRATSSCRSLSRISSTSRSSLRPASYVPLSIQMITILMKRISLILLAALGLLSLGSSCKKQQDVPRLSQVDFSVLEAKTYLPVESSTATVRLDKAPAKAYSSASWLQVAQEGATIRLTSTDNINPQSRNASLVLKDSKGDSIAINIMQAGIIFGLPKEQAMIGGDAAIDKTIKAPSNITVTYTTSADWIQLEPKDQQLRVIVAENTTGRPRTGWIIAKGVGLVDSLQVTQVDLSDIVGQYTQKSMTLDAATGTMVPLSSDVEIKKVSDTQAQFIIDGTYTWEAAFTPGQGLELLNGKVVKTATDPASGKNIYIMSVLAADDFTAEHKTYIIGTREPVLISVNHDGKLIFKEKSKISSEQYWASYGFVRSSSRQITQGTFIGIEKFFIQPKLEAK